MARSARDRPQDRQVEPRAESFARVSAAQQDQNRRHQQHLIVGSKHRNDDHSQRQHQAEDSPECRAGGWFAAHTPQTEQRMPVRSAPQESCPRIEPNSQPALTDSACSGDTARSPVTNIRNQPGNTNSAPPSSSNIMIRANPNTNLRRERQSHHRPQQQPCDDRPRQLRLDRRERQQSTAQKKPSCRAGTRHSREQSRHQQTQLLQFDSLHHGQPAEHEHDQDHAGPAGHPPAQDPQPEQNDSLRPTRSAAIEIRSALSQTAARPSAPAETPHTTGYANPC